MWLSLSWLAVVVLALGVRVVVAGVAVVAVVLVVFAAAVAAHCAILTTSIQVSCATCGDSWQPSQGCSRFEPLAYVLLLPSYMTATQTSGLGPQQGER